MMRKSISRLIFLFAVFTLFSNTAFAKIGVGVNTGKIQVDEKLKAGMIYKLPPITVINTGDEPAEYEASVAYHQDQPELRPEQNWFIFTPQKFHLEPGKGQLVEIKINLPLRIEPGNYFAYLEGHPLAQVQKGKATIGVAAASKLYFTVVPANIFYGIYYKITSFWKVYSPWPQRVTIALLIIASLLLFKKFFNIKINVKKPKDESSQADKTDELND
ncbi:hypothetical protein KKD61_00545 [Patescibacteria group bacterium]|nr:hypothetical protein [Patescibacteria group bacterium]